MKFNILILFFIISCQDTSVLEEGNSSVETSVDESLISNYSEVVGGYLNPNLTISQAISAIEEQTIVNPLFLNNTNVSAGDTVVDAIGKLQAQINSSSGTTAKFNLSTSNTPIYNKFGFFSDSLNHTNGIKFEEDESISLFTDKFLTMALSKDKVEIFADLFVNGQVFTLSDRDTKFDIKDLEHSNKVLEVRPVSFKWKDSGKKDFGVIAQQVKNIFPSAVTQGADGMHRVNYAKLIIPLIEVVKNQQREIERLKKAITKDNP